ncbi:hypothetical protein V6N12_059398 [Hibiscus sabdariffa]|uniref:RNase H type-1 domain-containing protein n=1 Tax=Hibiscus sabdariffa TaxID=183260 RepID=A0ABR2EV13_9ROSI
MLKGRLLISSVNVCGCRLPSSCKALEYFRGPTYGLVYGVSRVQVQSDISVAIRMILDPMTTSSSSSLVRRISSLLNRPWSLRFLWVHWEMNIVVDGLSKLPFLHDFQLQTFDNILESLRPLLVSDRDGPPYRRRC